MQKSKLQIRIQNLVKSKSAGFTLIELLVAATIISLLATVAIANYSSATKNSRDGRRKADLENVRAALELYRSQLGYYPNNGAGSWTNLSGLDNPLVTGGYIDKIPSDPKTGTTTPYQYKATNPVGSNYYGYCLQTDVEIVPTQQPCAPSSGYDYTFKNP